MMDQQPEVWSEGKTLWAAFDQEMRDQHYGIADASGTTNP
jgi:hypothetical protein